MVRQTDPAFPAAAAPSTMAPPPPATALAAPPATVVPPVPAWTASASPERTSESAVLEPTLFELPPAPVLTGASTPTPAPSSPARPAPKPAAPKRSASPKPAAPKRSASPKQAAPKRSASPKPAANRAGTTTPEALDPKTANIIYHDWEAASYDQKWSISFDERITAYAREKFLKVMPEARYGKVLEIGTGTGFFIINLWLAGLVENAYATDISPGMVEVCRRNAHVAGLTGIEARPADAEALPYPDDSFDLVVGHAVLHHLPDVPMALSECLRVLKPGGSLVITGEPTRIGHAVVHLAQRATASAVKLAGRVAPRILRGPDTSTKDPAAALEKHVDLHEFYPHHVRAWLRQTGFEAIDVQTEELVSGLFGWSSRTLEAMTAPGFLGERWPWFAYHTYIRLYRLDHLVVRRLVPKPFFYNLLFSARKPAPSKAASAKTRR